MANDFTGFNAVWLFNDALTDSSGNGNTISATGNTTYSSTSPAPLEGTKSISLDGNDAFNIADSSLSAAFPFKSSGGGLAMSVATLFNSASLPTTGNTAYLVCKYDSSGSRRIWAITITNDTGVLKARLTMGKTDGTFSENITIAPSNVTITTDTTYLLGAAIDASANKTYLVTIINCATLAQDSASGSLANQAAALDAPLYIGSTASGASFYTGLLDQVLITSSLLTATQFNYIAQGNYPAGPPASTYGGMMF